MKIPGIERTVDGDKHVLVDGACNQESAVLAIVRGKVGAPAAERDAQGASRHDHAGVLPSSEHPVVGLQEPERAHDAFPDGRASASSPASVIFEQSRKMKGLSPIHPRDPPVNESVGFTPSSSVMNADGVLDLDVLVRPEVEDVHLVLGLFDGKQDGVNAVLDVEVGLLLRAVAEHLQLAGLLLRAACRNRKHGRACTVLRGWKRT